MIFFPIFTKGKYMRKELRLGSIGPTKTDSMVCKPRQVQCLVGSGKNGSLLLGILHLENNCTQLFGKLLYIFTTYISTNSSDLFKVRKRNVVLFWFFFRYEVINLWILKNIKLWRVKKKSIKTCILRKIS